MINIITKLIKIQIYLLRASEISEALFVNFFAVLNLIG